MKRGYTPRTVPLHFDPTDPDYLGLIAARCLVLQAEMLEWANGATPKRFDGTLRALIEIYLRDQDSPFHSKRADTRRTYEHDLKVLDAAHGTLTLDRIGGKDLLRWHRDFKAPLVTIDNATGKQIVGPERLRRAHGLMVMLRIVINFGVVMEVPGCARLALILQKLRFASAPPRTSRLTAAHAAAICAAANAAELPSIAVAQAIQFELTLRQKDVIGEWVDVADPGMSDIVDRRQKWMRGIRWEQVDAGSILRHATSKTETALAFDLRQYPMVMAEIEKIAPAKRAGPLIVSEATGLPYRKRHFADVWREIADKAGVPRDVWNMDSRAGGVSEATDADSSGDALEAVRHHAGHRNITTTQRYSRASLEKNNKVAKIRVASRTSPNPDKDLA